jgi:hypothetical protein
LVDFPLPLLDEGERVRQSFPQYGGWLGMTGSCVARRRCLLVYRMVLPLEGSRRT